MKRSCFVKDHEWTFDENKRFGTALTDLIIDDDTPDFFEELRSRVPGNTDEQDEKHLEALLQDIWMIESGLITYGT